MRPKDLSTMGDIPGAQELHTALLRVLNYAQITAKVSPRSYDQRIPKVIRTLEQAISALQGFRQ